MSRLFSIFPFFLLILSAFPPFPTFSSIPISPTNQHQEPTPVTPLQSSCQQHMWHPLPQYTYLYNKTHENAELHKMILINKHKGIHVDKRFTFVLITKLKTYQLRVWKHFRLKIRSFKLTKELKLNSKIK